MIVLETKHILTELLKTFHLDFGPEFGQIVNSLGPEVTESIRSLLAWWQSFNILFIVI